MYTKEYKQYLEGVFSSEEYGLTERVITEGNGGEDEFDAKVLGAIVNKLVLGVGCGVGEFTIRIAEEAKEAYGLDFSNHAFFKAKEKCIQSKGTNVQFVCDGGCQ